MAAKAHRWTTCNVLAPEGEGRRLWQFTRRGDKAQLAADLRLGPDERPPADRVQKTFRHTWQPRFNIAWLPADKVFLRLVELPPGDPAEIPALIEFQLEKLSPLPLAQTLWTCEPLPAAAGEPLTAVLVVVERAAVEARLEQLEAAGYRPDRLELPLLRELLALPAPRDGVYVLAGREGGSGFTCLTAWWTEGRLRHLSLARFTEELRAGDALADALRRTAWAAEIEGWLPTPTPPVTLWAPAEVAAHFEPALRDFAGGALTVRERLAPAELAAVCATAPAHANLVPAEVLARYRQEFVDRLWMRALGVVALVYVFAVLGYLAWLSVLDYQKLRVDQQVALRQARYNQALQLKARLEILQEQVNLRFAALDCWKAVAETLPEGLTLNSLSFQRGKRLSLTGSVPTDQQGKVTEFNQALAAVKVGERPLFSQVTTKSIQGPAAGRADLPAAWSLECELNRRDLP
jgi:hypothetical protein